MGELKNKEKCPVCGMDVKTDNIRTDYKGHSYYFCNENDKKMFLEKPDRYIAKAKVA